MRNKIILSGFTLVELSVVLVILATLTAMGMSAGLGALESARRVVTNNRMDEIEKALFKFREKYDRLPCPGDLRLATTNANYGIEAAIPGTCFGGSPEATWPTGDPSTPVGVPSGAVPVQTLGLPLEYMYDGWGRKFQYEVAAEMTYSGAFQLSHPSNICTDNGITIRNEANNASITSGAVYALNSYGTDGIGGYLKSGDQLTVGTIGTYESYAYRALSDHPKYVYMYGTRGKVDTTTFYDHILRFKTRSQLMNDFDRTKNWYRGPTVLLAHDSNESAYARFVCGRLSTSETSGYDDAENNIRFGAFTNNNAYVFLYDHSTPTCRLYPVNNTGLGADTSAPSCPSNSTAFAMVEDTGRLALSLTSSPYVRMWNLSSGSHVLFNNPLATLLSATPTHMSFSDNGDYFAVSRSSATAYARLYKWSTSSYALVSPAPSSSYTVFNNAISPNGQYYVATVISGSNTIVHVWRLVNGTFTEFATTSTVVGMNTPNHIVFSPDSQYIALAGNGSTTELALVHVDLMRDTLSSVVIDTLPNTAYDPQMISFAADSSHLLLATGDLTQVTPFMLYRRTGADAFSLQVWPSVTVDTGPGNASTVATFSR